jgi:uncharacterized membrane protein YozB (DUF420 family)
MDGFLGTRASFMLDVVAMAMFVALPVLAGSIWLVRYRRRYNLHKRLQLALGIILLVTVVLFETDMRVNGWRARAEASPYMGHDGATNWVATSLAVHLIFSVTTTVLWLLVIVLALREFPNPPIPAQHSMWHRRLGYAAALDLACTAVTGWIFYWLAFVA